MRIAVNLAAPATPACSGEAMSISRHFGLVGAALLLTASAPGLAQIQTVDPSSPQVSSDLAPVPPQEADYGTQMENPPPPPPGDQPLPDPGYAPQPYSEGASPSPSAAPAPASTPSAAAANAPATATYREDEVFGAAERVFGAGAKGLAELLQKVLKDQGLPNAYIAGREGGGAVAVGLRYGQGTLYHKVEGERPVYWSGPSLGFDVGANAAKTFVLVYNLYDSEDLFRRFPAGEGNVYVIGGFTASYIRRGDIVVIPIRLGVGWRLGANVGYMKFTHNAKILPF